MPLYHAYANRLAQTLISGKPVDQIRAWKEIERLCPDIVKSTKLSEKIEIETDNSSISELAEDVFRVGLLTPMDISTTFDTLHIIP